MKKTYQLSIQKKHPLDGKTHYTYFLFDSEERSCGQKDFVTFDEAFTYECELKKKGWISRRNAPLPKLKEAMEMCS